MEFSAIMLEHATLEAVYVYFDTASYDQIERDEKVMVKKSHSHCMFTKKWSEGDSGRDDRIDRWHHGSSHWLLHPQWGWNHLLPHQVSLWFAFRWLPFSSGSSCPSRSPELWWSLLSTKDLKTIWRGKIKNLFLLMFTLHWYLFSILGGPVEEIR